MIKLNDPIEFIKKDKGILVRLKMIREMAHWHCQQAILSYKKAESIIELIETDVSQ